MTQMLAQLAPLRKKRQEAAERAATRLSSRKDAM